MWSRHWRSCLGLPGEQRKDLILEKGITMDTASSLKQKAIEKTGLSDFGDSYFEETLKLWVNDLAHYRLSDFGRTAFTNQMIGDLARRLRVIDCLRKNPEIEDVTIPPILYISGLERTGTTFLHNLLNLDPKARAFKRWELMNPVPPPEAATYETDARIAKAQMSIDKLRGTLLEQMHWVNADDPEECAWGMIDGSGILGSAASAAMPQWGQPSPIRNPERAFLEYRSIIKLLLWKNPIPDGGHLVLKAPQFLSLMPVFLDMLPEAQLILMHRDPFRAITSVCALVASILDPFFKDSSLLHNSAYLPATTGQNAERRLDIISAFCRSRSDVTHIAYPDLIEDPVATVGSIYLKCGMTMPDGLEARLASFIADQKAGKRAKPPGALPTFGLDHDEFLSRPSIARYCAHFGVEPERSRQTGV